MLIALIATTYLALALTIVVAVDQIARLMFRVPGEVVPRRRLDIYGLVRRVVKTRL